MERKSSGCCWSCVDVGSLGAAATVGDEMRPDMGSIVPGCTAGAAGGLDGNRAGCGTAVARPGFGVAGAGAGGADVAAVRSTGAKAAGVPKVGAGAVEFGTSGNPTPWPKPETGSPPRITDRITSRKNVASVLFFIISFVKSELGMEKSEIKCYTAKQG